MTISTMRAAEDQPVEGTLRAWLSQTLPLTGRQLTVWARQPFTLAQSILMPALTMLLFKIVLGDSITQVTGQSFAFNMVPMIVLTGAMFGSMAAAVRLNQERATGLLTRLYVMPINRAADVSSRIISELIRILVTTVVLLAAGHLVGFRFNQGPLAAIGLVGIAFLYGVAFSMMVLALAVNTRPNAPLVPYLSLLSSVLMFFNSGFVPVQMYPGWIQPLVTYQPMTPAINTMRSLAVGGPIATDLVLVIAWSVALLGIFTYPALSGYRKAAASR